jgi:hypothetical protein
MYSETIALVHFQGRMYSTRNIGIVKVMMIENEFSAREFHTCFTSKPD